MVRIHNRPAYNSECHATRDMGVGELNNSYEDAQLADTIFCHRCQPLRDADQLFPGPLGAQPDGRHRGQKEEVVPGRNRSGHQGHHRRPASHRHRGHLRTGGRQGQCAAPGHRTRLRHRPVQYAVHLCGGARLARQSVHRTAHQGFRGRGQDQPHVAGRRHPGDRHSRGQAQAGRRMGLQAQGVRPSSTHHASLTRKASSGATTTT